MDQNVVKVDDDISFFDLGLENVIHHTLKSGWWIAETEKHNQWFEKSKFGDKSRFPFVAGTNANVVVTPTNVEFSEPLWVSQFVDDIDDLGDWISIRNGHSIQLSIVLHRS